MPRQATNESAVKGRKKEKREKERKKKKRKREKEGKKKPPHKNPPINLSDKAIILIANK